MAGPSRAHAELLAHVDTLPLVDVHTHLQATAPSARDLADIVFYEYLAFEMLSIGLPRELLDRARPLDQRLPHALPYLRQVRNTTAWWCADQILRELYGWTAPLTEANWREIDERVRAAGTHKDRPGEVLRRRARAETTFVTVEMHQAGDPAWNALGAGFYQALRLDPFAFETDTGGLGRLESLTGCTLDTDGAFEDAIGRFVRACCNQGPVAALAVSLPPGPTMDIGAVSSAEVARLLDRAHRRPGSMAAAERQALRAVSLIALVRVAAEAALPVQLMVGIDRSLPLGAELPLFHPRTLADLIPIFAGHPEVRFDVFLANPLHGHELSVIAKSYPNVLPVGHWWYSNNPSVIRQELRDRLELLPATKLVGFFSDAHCAEWTLGKARLARREIARTLADMVVDGYIAEEDAGEIAFELLCGNARRLYPLSQHRTSGEAGEARC